MDLLPISFLILVVILGGIIAIAADRLGRKLGKKRLTLFGLRPRHTAELLTVGAGVIIPVMTIGLLYVGSTDFRKWVLEGRKAIEELRITQTELASERLELRTDAERAKALQSKNASLEAQNSAVQRRLLVADSKIQTAERSLEGLRTKRAQLEARIVVFQREVRSYGARVALLGGQLRHTQEILKSNMDRLASTRKQWSSLNASYKELDKHVREMNQHDMLLLSENSKLESDRQGLEESNKRLAENSMNLQAAIQKGQTELTRIQSDLEEARTELETSKQQLNEADLELANAMAATQSLGATLVDTRRQPMIFRSGEEIARYPIEPKLSGAQAASAVSSLLREARVEAANRGSQERSGLPTAFLFARADSKGQRAATPDELESMLVTAVTGKDEPEVLVAYAWVNSFRGEPVPLRVQVFSNPEVYHANQVVAEARIDGRKETSEILRQITAFIGTQVRDRAKRDKMIPRLGTDEAFGSVPPDRLIDLVSEIRASDRTVRLQAYSPSDIRAADPLRLEFRIR